MSSPGSRPNRGGFMARLQSAMVPVLPEDGAPLVRPRGVLVASVLVIVAAVLLLLSAIANLTSIDSQIATAQSELASSVQQCNTALGGIGTAVPSTVATPTTGATTPVPLTALPSYCAAVTQSSYPASTLSSYRQTVNIFSVLSILIALGAAAGGWYLNRGRRWARRVLIGVVLIQLVFAFLLQYSSTITLLATLLVVVGLAITFVGMPSAFFTATAQRKKLH